MARNGNYKDLTGQTFGLLKVIGRDIGKTDISHSCFWICECQCKDKTIVSRRTSTLKRGNLSNCGCVQRERLLAQSKSREKHGLTNSTLFHVWVGMRDRCSNPNSPRYKRYGGRGICLCEEWNNDFLAFYNWAIMNGYEKGLTIDRIDYDGNYCPENCRWITNSEQQYNKSTVPLYPYKGEMISTGQFQKMLGIPCRGYAWYRIKRGMSLQQIADEWEASKTINQKYKTLNEYAKENGITRASALWKIKTGKLSVTKVKGYYYILRKETEHE